MTLLDTMARAIYDVDLDLPSPEAMRAALAAAEAHGYVLVPKEPTEDMQIAWDDTWTTVSFGDCEGRAFIESWAAMLSARPPIEEGT